MASHISLVPDAMTVKPLDSSSDLYSAGLISLMPFLITAIDMVVPFMVIVSL